MSPKPPETFPVSSAGMDVMRPEGDSVQVNHIVTSESAETVLTPASSTPTNYCQVAVAVLRKTEDAMGEVMHLPDEGKIDSLFLVPSPEHGRLLRDISEAVHASYGPRNVADPEFQNICFGAHSYLSRRRNESGHKINYKRMHVRGAVPRGYLVVMQASLGRHATAMAVANYLGDAIRAIDVPGISGTKGFTRFYQIPALCVDWPSDGSIRSFGEAFVAKLESVMSPVELDMRSRFRSNNEETISAAMCAAALALNLGVLIVERVNTSSAKYIRAERLWDALVEFTRDTGIVVLCFATPGAVAALSEHGAAITSLSCGNLYQISPEHELSEGWEVFSRVLFRWILKSRAFPKQPSWYSLRLRVLSHGHHSVAVKIARYIRSVTIEDEEQLTEGRFESLARKATVLERPHFMAARAAESSNRIFTKASLRKHGDWLSLSSALKTVPGLDEELLLPSPANGGNRSIAS